MEIANVIKHKGNTWETRWLVYFLLRENEVVYIGRSKSLASLQQRLYCHRRYGKMFDDCEIYEIGDYEQSKIEERKWIKYHQPTYNRQCIPGRIGNAND